MARRLVFVLAVGWVVAVALSIVLPIVTPPTGDGFTRGLNRVGAILLWQFVALVLAIAAFGVSRMAARRAGRLFKLAALGPIGLSGLAALVFVGIILWARFAPQPVVEMPPASPAPVTEPAETVPD